MCEHTYKMGRKMKNTIRNLLISIFTKLIPEIRILRDGDISWSYIRSSILKSDIDSFTKLYSPYRINNSVIGKGTYIASNSFISFTKIGRYCSIGPNFFCGWGIHPTDGLSTSPMFYSKCKQNGRTLSDSDKIQERKQITIGNDVFIGVNVTVLDGVTIGDGAIIGAGAVVSKDIPPYSIAVGSPIKILRSRLPEEYVGKLLSIKWWNFEEDKLKEVEKHFFNIDEFLNKYYKGAE